MEQIIYDWPKGLNHRGNTYCPGCMHSTAAKIIAQVLEENDWLGDAILVVPVGCSLCLSGYLDFDTIMAFHGRAAAVATGVKSIRKDKLVMSYQGDGDAIAIGFSESFYNANRGFPVTAIVINNQVYGMTGGQMSPTTLLGQRTVTTSKGRNIEKKEGYPVHLAEIIATLKAPAYVARFALHTPKHILQAKKGIEKAFRLQLEENKYSYIELLSACPTNWGISPKDGPKYMEEKVIPEFPVGEFKTI
jgi:2-oxoglutarate ferredoxin oxidoreductase subunit beta